jgi:hypothetical protein
MNTPFALVFGFIVVSIAVSNALSHPPLTRSPRERFVQDQSWPDDKGEAINAHGGSVMFHDGFYYWFGESYPDPKDTDPGTTGVHCYSSTDLYNWKDEGVVLARVKDPQSDISEGCIIERPKVLRNPGTGKFVMWFHLERKGHGYSDARCGVAVADKPAGPYTFVRSERPDAGVLPLNVTEQERRELASIQQPQKNAGGVDEKAPRISSAFIRDFPTGQMSRDMTLFMDDDGIAYHVFASEDNATLHIAQLGDDYLSHNGKWTRVLIGDCNEATAVCKAKGRYWLVTSGCTGWDPNTARLSVADSIWGPWKVLGNPLADGERPAGMPRLCVEDWKKQGQPSVGGDGKNNPGAEKTFGGQSTFIFPVNGKSDAFIAMFDIWRPNQQAASGYVWLPVVVEKDLFTIPWRDRWDLSVFEKSPGHPETR